MGGVEENFPEPVVILADGEPPSHPAPLSILESAGTLICTDGAAATAVRLGRNPDIVIGDMDSVDKASLPDGAQVIDVPQQNSTDLEKALDFCIKQGVQSATLLGLSGGREDHMLANFAVMIDASAKLELSAVTDHHTVHPLTGERKFSFVSGATISLLTPHGEPAVTTEGLKYPLENEALCSGGHGISNVAEGSQFSVRVTGGVVLVFIGHGD